MKVHYPFLVLKDFECAPEQVVAFGKSIVPRTVSTPEYPTISVWLSTVKEAITILYETDEEQEADLIKLRAAVDKARTVEHHAPVN